MQLIQWVGYLLDDQEIVVQLLQRAGQLWRPPSLLFSLYWGLSPYG